MRDRIAQLERERDALRQAVKWYGEKAEAFNRYFNLSKDEAMMAVVTELRLDQGKRALNALAGTDHVASPPREGGSGQVTPADSVPALPHVHINETGKLVHLVLEDAPAYGEWIPGEGSDVVLSRAIDDNRIVGAHLPFPPSKPHGEGKPVPLTDVQPLIEALERIAGGVEPFSAEEARTALARWREKGGGV